MTTPKNQQDAQRFALAEQLGWWGVSYCGDRIIGIAPGDHITKHPPVDLPTLDELLAMKGGVVDGSNQL